MSQIRYSEVVAHLLEALPEIRRYYEKRSVELYANGNAHVVYGSILVEYISALANDLFDHDKSNEILIKAFDFIERLASSTDFEVQCLIETSVLEALLGEKGGLDRFAEYMGSETKRLAQGIALQWGLGE
jgi:hypothetical protein